MTRDELKAIEERVADGFTHVGDNRILLARITELEAENKRILGSHDAYADKYEDELLDRKSAEALADDLENQIAELTLRMDEAEELRKMGVEPPTKALALTARARQVISGDGSRIMDVVKAVLEWRNDPVRVTGLEDAKRLDPPTRRERELLEALDRLDGKEPTP